MAEDSENHDPSDGLPNEFPLVRYFAEGITLDVDLMTFEVDEKVFGGRLRTIVELSRAMLQGLRGIDVNYLLLMGDTVVGSQIQAGREIAEQHGEKRPLLQDVLDCIPAVEMLAFVAGSFDGASFVIREDEEETQLDLTAHRLCAAFVLGQSFSAIRYGTDVECVAFGAYHAMQAAEAYAMAKLLSGEEAHLAPLVGKQHLGEQVRKAAAARLLIDSDGKQAAKAQALMMWQEWQAGRALYKSGAQFALEVVKVTGIDSTKTVERWIVKWRAEAKNRD